MLLDGEHLVQAALAAGITLDAVLTDGRAHTTADRARDAGVPVHDVSTAVIDAAAPVRTPGGVLALARWQASTIADALPHPNGLVLALVDVQDPGNVGNVIRSADALGVAAVLTLGATADPANWKALRGAMGSTFRLPVGRGETHAAIDLLHERGWDTIVTTPEGGVPLHAHAFDRPTAVLLGNEGGGLPADVTARARGRLTIPMRDEVESLNVATTAALVAYEVHRRRTAPGQVP